MKRILIIGCGHMGSSLLRAWLNVSNYKFYVVDPIKYKILKKDRKFKNINFYNDLKKIDDYTKFSLIVFATKPIDLKHALEILKNKKFNKNCIAISVIAGKKLKDLSNKLKNIDQFVRVMPNMPALIGQGMNCIVPNNLVTKKNKKIVNNLFKHTGKVLFLKSENEIDMATAVSGSGPGYVYNLIDAMEKASINLGFSKTISKMLVSETFRGSVNLLIQNKRSAEDLTKTVATKGGTTEAGLKIMNENKIHEIFKKLIKASYKKAKMQGKK